MKQLIAKWLSTATSQSSDLRPKKKVAQLECSIAKSFWNKFTNWYNATCEGNIALKQNEIIYGVLRYTSSCLTLNHLIIIGKYFLYINRVHDEKRPQFTDFVTLVNEKIELEKYIAITTNKLLSFAKKWSNFLSI